MQFDLIIIGGGMVGASLALRLADSGKRIALVEQKQPDDYQPDSPCDLRVSALNRSSQQLLESVGAWPRLLDMRAHLFKRLSVWQQGCSRTDFDADDIGASHLGYIAENKLVQLALWQQLKKSDVECIVPESVTGLVQHDDHIEVLLAGGAKLTAALVAATDGAQSAIRQQSGIGVTGWDYQQDAMVISVGLKESAPEITWQAFFESGPRALLPLPNNQASLVWYDAPKRVAQLLKLNDLQLSHEILNAFPEQLPEFEILSRGSFPLRRQHANHYVNGRVVLLGDAAHVINPLAGQGVNLGFKDVLCFAEEIEQASDVITACKRYERRRRPENLLMMSTMDGLYKTFSSDKAPVRLLRNVGLWLADRPTPLKRAALKHAMGLPMF
ncbi:FAD-dependent oxidoreductase [Corallincola platygyrae]|uniref:FAD-dependent oxidoreductase n=1 Tax=Corallincola platygyrae TaxID=1193278 RepID=A0ABW4XRR4_9GAMM